MSANTITGLIPTIYEALDQVAREQVGFIPAVMKDSSAARAAKGETISWPIVPKMTSSTITPAATGPDASGVAYGAGTMSIDYAESVTFPWNGEETKGAQNAGLYNTMLQNTFAQAFRTLANKIELALFTTAYKGASRAIAVADTSLFKTDVSDFANLLKLLKDNGTPDGDLHVVFSTTAGAALRKMSILTKANESGSPNTLRTGNVGSVLGFNLHESNQVAQVGTAAAASYIVDTAGAVLGATSIPIKTGTAAITSGDVFVIAGDTNKYVVNTSLTGAGNLAIGSPGLLIAADSTDALTFNGVYTPAVAFDRMAIALMTRVPAQPEGGDAATDAVSVTDPVSGLTFEVRKYSQYHQISYEVGIAWGTKVVKPDFLGMVIQ